MNSNFEVITLNKKGITDFAKERNLLLSKAKRAWVLFLDSDEELSGRILISDGFNGYRLRRDNYFLGKFVGSDLIVRLARKDSGKWVRRVHEVWKVKGKIGTQKAYIIHNTADNLTAYIEKINFYSDLHARANMEEGKSSNLFKIIFFPRLKFILTLFKSKNVIFSIMQSFHSFLSWTKLYFLRS